MTSPKENNELCVTEAEGNIEGEGKQNSLFPVGPVIKCFVIPPFLFSSCLKAFSSHDCKKNYLLDAGWYTNLPRFQDT